MRQYYILQDAIRQQYVMEQGAEPPKVKEFNSPEEIQKFVQDPTTPESVYEAKVHFDNRKIQPEIGVKK